METKKLSFKEMENVFGGGCNDRGDQIGAGVLCSAFYVMSFIPVTWAIGAVGSAGCLAISLGCAYLM